MRNVIRAAATVVVALIGLAVPAAAHVTIQPGESSTGAFARFVVRVPNESERAATVKVEVQMPAELGEVRYQPKPGWRRTVSGKTVTWEGGRIEPGEFEEFGFSTRMPDRPGALAFPAIQTYDDGEVAQWTGPADADRPAGRVTVKQAAGGTDSHGATTATSAHDGDGAAAGADGDAAGDDDGTDPLVFASLALGGLGVLLGLAGLLRGRRT